MSSSMFYLELLLKIPPDEVLLDFLAQCGLTLSFEIERPEGDAYKRLRIATAIERAPESVRGCILAGMRHVALLADAAGLDALRAANEAHAGQVNPLHLPDAPAQCALWMYLRGRLAKLYGGTDVHWGEKARADFSTVVLTPESPMQAPPAAIDEDPPNSSSGYVEGWRRLFPRTVRPFPAVLRVQDT